MNGCASRNREFPKRTDEHGTDAMSKPATAIVTIYVRRGRSAREESERRKASPWTLKESEILRRGRSSKRGTQCASVIIHVKAITLELTPSEAGGTNGLQKKPRGFSDVNNGPGIARCSIWWGNVHLLTQVNEESARTMINPAHASPSKLFVPLP